jgi:hypothetical protein
MAMRWTSLAAPVALMLGLVVPSAALAAGGPVPPVQGTSIGVPGSPDRYVALGARADTVIKQFRPGSGQRPSEVRVPGRYGVSGVDLSGDTTGLSADGRTLVLADLPAYLPPRTTRLLVLDTPRLAVRAKVVLPGYWTVDAISPDARWLYLIHYPSSDISKYEVRAYDLRAHLLLDKPIVDPSDRGEAMTGFAIARVMSAGDRWAYTLYFRPSGAPFVHALDTVGRRAVCVDLPSTVNLDPGNAQARLASGGGTLEVVTDGATRARVDTRTLTVTSGAVHREPAPRKAPVSHQHGVTSAVGDGPPWDLIVVAITALAALAWAAAGRWKAAT